MGALTHAVMLSQVVNGCNIFARASPENKLRIVRALQTGPGYDGPMDGDDPDDDGPVKSRTSTSSCARGPGYVMWQLIYHILSVGAVHQGS